MNPNKLSITSLIVDGQIPYKVLDYLSKTCLAYNNKNLKFTVELVTEYRSQGRMQYYFAVIVPLVQIGILKMYGEYWSIEKTHQFLKNKFNANEILFPEIIQLEKSTTKNNEFQQEIFHTKCKQFLYESLNIIAPERKEDLEIYL